MSEAKPSLANVSTRNASDRSPVRTMSVVRSCRKDLDREVPRTNCQDAVSPSNPSVKPSARTAETRQPSHMPRANVRTMRPRFRPSELCIASANLCVPSPESNHHPHHTEASQSTSSVIDITPGRLQRRNRRHNRSPIHQIFANGLDQTQVPSPSPSLVTYRPQWMLNLCFYNKLQHGPRGMWDTPKLSEIPKKCHNHTPNPCDLLICVGCCI
jgi:hypothetical protein